MKAFVLDDFDAPPAARDDMPPPTPEASDVVVRVHASSATPADAAIAAGMVKGMAEHRFPVTLGRDYAGAVESVGADVTRYAPGDEVFGFVPMMNPDVRDGAWAELITVPEDAHIARKPSGLDFAAAGAAPLSAITALGSIDAVDLTEGDTVLIIGATGGVGTFAVQLAASAGATVVASALAEDEAYLRELGVAEFVPREGDVSAEVRQRYPDGVDALIDLVSFGAPGTYEPALKEGGRVASSVNAAGEGPGRTNVVAVPSPENLERVARLLEAGDLGVRIQRTYELEDAGLALQDLAARHTRGKLAVRVA